MINIVDGKPYLEQVKELIQEYTQWLGRDLSFQNLDKELTDIAEKYMAPNGELLVAIDDNDVVLGMVAYYQHSDTRCEMKRLYVRPEGRGHALGDRLIESIMDHAKDSGYKEMVLDTIERYKQRSICTRSMVLLNVSRIIITLWMMLFI